jgi:tetratricopeptide (TPR) repeat protein
MEKIYPDDKEMIYNIGDWSYHLKDYTNAITYLKKTLQIDPNHQRALQHLTYTYMEMGDFNKMLETAKQYMAVSGSSESYQLLGFAYSELGQMEEALRTLQRTMDLFPDNTEVIRAIADSYTYLGLYPKAEQAFLKLIEENQSPNIIHYGYDRLAEFYPYQGKYHKALYYADKGIELSWQNGDTVRALVSHNRKATLLLFG